MYLLSFLILIISASALVFEDPLCPDFEKSRNINLSSYEDSTWYEIARYPNEFQTSEQCFSLKFKMDGDTLIGTVNIVPGKTVEYFEIAVKPDDEESNENSIVAITYGDPQKIATIKTKDIISTDHGRFDIYYSCEYDKVKKTRQEYAWIYGQSNVMKGDVRSVVENLIDSYDFLDANKFLWIDNSVDTCKIH